MCVATSDIRGAGTDASVDIVLVGGKEGLEKVSESFRLETSQKNFERGQVDEFMLHRVKRLGIRSKVTIGHDGRGNGAGRWGQLFNRKVLDQAILSWLAFSGASDEVEGFLSAE